MSEPHPHPAGTDMVPLTLPRSPTGRKTCLFVSRRQLDCASALFSEIDARVNSISSGHLTHLLFTVQKHSQLPKSTCDLMYVTVHSSFHTECNHLQPSRHLTCPSPRSSRFLQPPSQSPSCRRTSWRSLATPWQRGGIATATTFLRKPLLRILATPRQRGGNAMATTWPVGRNSCSLDPKLAHPPTPMRGFVASPLDSFP